MPTVVLPPRHSTDTQTLKAAALRLGWEVWIAPGYRLPDSLRLTGPVLYGDVLFCDVAAGSLNLALLEPPIDWLIRVPRRYLGRAVHFTTLSEARKQSQQLFAKPADDKCFPATVYNSGTELPGDNLLAEDTPVLLSEPVVWESEFRCFVASGKVQALSVYCRYGELVETPEGEWPASSQELAEARAFAEQVLNDAESHPLPPSVLDVGSIQGFGWAVIEANPAWGSGIYGCNTDGVLSVVQSASILCSNLTPVEAVFARPFRHIEE